MLNEVLKSCKKMIFANIKTDVKQEIKVLVAVSYNFPQKHLLCSVKRGCIFNLILVGIPSSLILSVKNIGVRGFLLNGQNLLSMTKVIC